MYFFVTLIVGLYQKLGDWFAEWFRRKPKFAAMVSGVTFYFCAIELPFAPTEVQVAVFVILCLTLFPLIGLASFKWLVIAEPPRFLTGNLPELSTAAFVFLVTVFLTAFARFAIFGRP